MVAKKYRNYEIPSEFSGVWRYLGNAYSRDEFTNTCAADVEIEQAYKDVAKRLGKWNEYMILLKVFKTKKMSFLKRQCRGSSSDCLV